MIKEGDLYSYIHRSFQEYFVAVFLANQDVDRWGDVVERLQKEKPNDTVVSLLFDINRDRFEREFLLPRVTALSVDLSHIDVAKNPAAAFDLFYLGISALPSDRGISSWTIGQGARHPKWYYLTRFIETAEVRATLDGDFDWPAHFRAHGALEHEHEEIELQDVTDESLIGTPMVDFLMAVKASAEGMRDALNRSTRTQKKLLASSLFRRSPRARRK